VKRDRSEHAPPAEEKKKKRKNPINPAEKEKPTIAINDGKERFSKRTPREGNQKSIKGKYHIGELTTSRNQQTTPSGPADQESGGF